MRMDEEGVGSKLFYELWEGFVVGQEAGEIAQGLLLNRCLFVAVAIVQQMYAVIHPHLLELIALACQFPQDYRSHLCALVPQAEDDSVQVPPGQRQVSNRHLPNLFVVLSRQDLEELLLNLVPELMLPSHRQCGQLDPELLVRRYLQSQHVKDSLKDGCSGLCVDVLRGLLDEVEEHAGRCDADPKETGKCCLRKELQEKVQQDHRLLLILTQQLMEQARGQLLKLRRHFPVGPLVEDLENFEIGQLKSLLEASRVQSKQPSQFEHLCLGCGLHLIDVVEDCEDGIVVCAHLLILTIKGKEAPQILFSSYSEALLLYCPGIGLFAAACLLPPLLFILLLVLFGDCEVVQLLEGGFIDRTGVVQRPCQQSLLEEVPIDHPAARKQRILQLQMLPLPLSILMIRHYSLYSPLTLLGLLLRPEQLNRNALSKRIKIFIQKQFLHLLVDIGQFILQNSFHDPLITPLSNIHIPSVQYLIEGVFKPTVQSLRLHCDYLNSGTYHRIVFTLVVSAQKRHLFHYLKEQSQHVYTVKEELHGLTLLH